MCLGTPLRCEQTVKEGVARPGVEGEYPAWDLEKFEALEVPAGTLVRRCRLTL